MLEFIDFFNFKICTQPQLGETNLTVFITFLNPITFEYRTAD